MKFRRTLQRSFAALSAAGLLVAPLASQAVDLTCSLPNANITKALLLCEALRIELRVRKSSWTNNTCASYIFRIGMIEAEKRRVRREVRMSTQSVVRDAVSAFTETWPKPDPVRCGDGIVDREFLEECDNGDKLGSEGCSTSCLIE